MNVFSLKGRLGDDRLHSLALIFHANTPIIKFTLTGGGNVQLNLRTEGEKSTCDVVWRRRAAPSARFRFLPEASPSPRDAPTFRQKSLYFTAAQLHCVGTTLEIKKFNQNRPDSRRSEVDYYARHVHLLWKTHW